MTAFRAAPFCFSIRVAARGKEDAAFPLCRLFCGAEQHKIGGTEKEPTFVIRPCSLHTPSVLFLEHQPSWAVEISNVVLLPCSEWLRWDTFWFTQLFFTELPPEYWNVLFNGLFSKFILITCKYTWTGFSLQSGRKILWRVAGFPSLLRY